jgi:nicotinamide-nucleotide amidase
MPATEIIRVLAGRGESLASAESLTGGLLAAALTEVPGASAVFRGGVVAYQTPMKQVLAGVDPAVLAEFGPVSEATAHQLARGVRERLGADWGIATTGVAGPDPQDGHPVGEVWIAVAAAHSTVVRQLSLSGGRAEIRAQTVSLALALLGEVLVSSRDGAAPAFCPLGE